MLEVDREGTAATEWVSGERRVFPEENSALLPADCFMSLLKMKAFLVLSSNN